MGKMMLICVLLSALLPPTITEPPPTDKWTTPQKNEITPEPASGTSNKVYTPTTVTPKAIALKIGTETATTALTQQNTTIANLEATTMHDKNVQTAVSYTKKMSNSSMDLATSTASVEISNPADKITSSAVSSTSSGSKSTAQTNKMYTESAKVAVPTETANTRDVPTAKLSATTLSERSVQNTTTERAKTTKSVPSSTQPVPSFQKTTMKPGQTTAKIHPPLVTEGHVETQSKTNSRSDDAKKSVKHGKIVAGLIGGALIVMMIGFLVILYKKRQMKKQQIATTDWAGPTPFLEAGRDDRNNGHVTLRSASRISLTSFLPQRFSKRMSLLAESAEEMQDMQEMTVGTTFGAKEEKNGTKSDQTLETSIKEVKENYSEGSEKTEEVALIDETKEAEGETGKEPTNGQETMKEGENGPVENTPTQPAPKEDAPIETKDENKEHTENDGGDDAA